MVWEKSKILGLSSPFLGFCKTQEIPISGKMAKIVISVTKL